jgi:uncharacterized iron-regulated protein
MADQEEMEFLELGEVAVRINQMAGDAIASAPEHVPFTDEDENALSYKCLRCEAIYLIAYSRIHGTKRSFEDLSDQLQLRLEEDHTAGRQHHSLVALRWSDTTRKRSREEKS